MEIDPKMLYLYGLFFHPSSISSKLLPLDDMEREAKAKSEEDVYS
jgi:hypothetical protein